MLPQLSPLSVSLCTPDLIPSQRIWWIWGKVILAAALWPSARQLKSSISTMYRAPACSGRRQARGWVAAMSRFQAARGNLTLSSPNSTPPALLLTPPTHIAPRPACLTLVPFSSQKSVYYRLQSPMSDREWHVQCACKSLPDPRCSLLFCFCFLWKTRDPHALTDSNRCASARVHVHLSMDRYIHQRKPESYRCSSMPNKLPPLAPCCHQCELEKRWICSIPQRCYFHTHALSMLSRNQKDDREEKTIRLGVVNF